MKLERLRNDNRKRIAIGVIITVCIISALMLVGSRAKYRGTQSIPLVNGTINYSPGGGGDLNVMAIYLVDKEQETSVDKIPTKGYTYNSTRSYCTTDGKNRNESITITYANNSIAVSNLTEKGTKCYFYFDRIPDTTKPVISKVEKTSDEYTSITIKVTASDIDTGFGEGTVTKYYYSIDNGTYQESENNTYTFSGLEKETSHLVKVKVEDASGNQTEWSGTFATKTDKKPSEQTLENLGLIATTDEGLKSETDDWGTTYYFTGSSNNNWVKFAGFYWRILRINGDGSIRLIYNTTSTNMSGQGLLVETANKFNSFDDPDNAYVGYMYGTAGSSTYAATHANTNDSEVKKVLDKWYKENIYDKGYDGKISKEAGFCNDRSLIPSNQTSWVNDSRKGYGKEQTAYGFYVRAKDLGGNDNKPKFSCPNASNDLFTVSDSTKGNHALTYPVGLITGDEVLAVAMTTRPDKVYQTVTVAEYWTMTPSIYSWRPVVVTVAGGSVSVLELWPSVTNGVRPVLNLASDVKFTYNNESMKGSPTDPYVVS